MDEKLRMCLARRQLVKEEREREFQFRTELKLKEMEDGTAITLHQIELMSSWPTPVGAQVFRSLFVGNDIHLVLVFSESSVHSFFIAFECMATSLHWPQDVYCVMLLCTLTDKTHEACSGLLTEDCLVYKKLMNLYLKPVGSISEV